ncbi:MAG: signal peptidase signal peptidase [Parcubacteria group bacterium]|nr:signal peptidase signal peptidase [Parcubacteria group bacterium]
MKFLESAFKEILTFIVLAIIIVVPIRLFVAQPFVVEGESMHPTFESGNYLIVDELTYHLSEPKRGDVVIFRYPGDPTIFYIKRIIGLPGETVHIDHGQTSVTKTDGTSITLDESYVVSEDATYTQDTTLGTDQYFVMGDNRPRSSDSRIWGALPKKNIVGRAYVRLLPFDLVGILPGAANEPQ